MIGGPGVTRVLVTGASGYIGSRLVPVLAANPAYRVRALVRKPASFLAVEDQRVVDLLGEPECVDDACSGVDVVVHLAGPNEVIASQEPERALAETVVAAQRVARSAARAGVARLVYVSTVHVYGGRIRDGATLREETPAEPRSVYAIARLASEHLMASAGDSVEVIVCRLTNAVGAPADPAVDRWSLVSNDLCRQGVCSGELRLRSSGAQWRDFIALADVCRVLNDVVVPGRLAAGTYNLCSGRSHTVRQLAGLIQDAFEARGLGRPPLRAPELPPDAPQPYHVSPDRLAAAGGWVATTTLADAVAETVEFCVARRDQL